MKFKKSQLSFLQILIISLITLLLIFSFFYIFQKSADPKTRFYACRKFVEVNAFSRLGAHTFKNDIVCPTENISIDSSDEEEVKKIIADKMKEGFDIFRPPEGSIDWTLFDHDAVYCYTNNVVFFDDNVKPIKGLTEYLLTKEVSKGITYMDYFRGAESKEALSVLNYIPKDKLAQDVIGTSNPYAVVVVYARGKDKIKDFIKRADSLSGRAVVGGGIAYVGGTIVLLTFSGPVGWIGAGVAGIGALVTIGSAYYNYFLGQGADVEYVLNVFFKEYDKKTFEDLGCEEFPVLQSVKS